MLARANAAPMMPRTCLQETSEEVRLQIVELVRLFVPRLTPRMATQYIEDLSAVMCRALEDGFHDIKKVACACLTSLAPAAGAAALEPHAERLLTSLVHNLVHSHSRVRCGAAVHGRTRSHIVSASVM